MTDTKTQAKLIRTFRWIHRKIAIPLLIFFFVMALTGLLLGLKKNTGLLAPTKKGSAPGLANWVPLDSLEKIAIQTYRDSISAAETIELDRIDIRPDKGIAKFSFKNSYHGLQIDGTTGKILLVERRTSDLIEDIHDGSFIDNLVGTGDEEVKVVYTTIMGLSLLLLVISGFWLWYGPKKIRRERRHHP